MNLLSLLTSTLASNASVDQLSNKTGLSDKQIKKLLRLAIPMLLYALTANAKSKQGASSLVNALSQHTSTSPAEKQIKNADTVDGAKIISHILGANQNSQIGSLAAQTGLSASQVSSVLSNIAPALLSGVSGAAAKPAAAAPKVDLSDGLDMGDVMGFLSQAAGASTTSTAKADGSALLGVLSALMK